VAASAATDVGNQEACNNSRYHFVEGSVGEVDRYCAELLEQLGIERPRVDAVGHATPPDIRDEVDVLRHLEPAYRVWGDYSGRGLVVRSEEPADFHPTAKTVNVIPVARLVDAVRYANVSTKTVGVYPSHRKAEFRDALVSAGVERVTTLGGGYGDTVGMPHDAMLVLGRLVRWVVECD
jgi:hypothetical protein